MTLRLPKFNSLTKEQQDIIEAENSFGIYGGAGTGKTMVSIWRHIQNWKNGEKSYLITFTHTLTYFLETLVFQEQENAKKYINNSNSFLKDLDKNLLPHIQELIIDEAQDLDEISNQKIKNKFSNISYGADNNQALYEKSTLTNTLENIYKPQNTLVLSLNFRNSFNILNFAKSIFPDYGITEKMIKYSESKYNLGLLPKIFQHNKNIGKDICNLISQIPESENIAILVPTLNIMEYYRGLFDCCLESENYSTYNYKDLGNIRSLGIQRVHLTTFHSSKGLEFDNVIIPEFQLFRSNNLYYVGITRAKTSLYLFSKEINPLENINSKLYELIKI